MCLPDTAHARQGQALVNHFADPRQADLAHRDPAEPGKHAPPRPPTIHFQPHPGFIPEERLLFFNGRERRLLFGGLLVGGDLCTCRVLAPAAPPR